MLSQIRDKIVGPIGLIVLGIIAVSFVFFGATLNFAGSPYAAKVDGEEIGIINFENTYRSQLDANPQLAQLPPVFRGQLRRNVLQSMIRERLIEMHLQDAGYQVSETQLTEAIQQIPDFQVDGQFNLEAAEDLLAQNGMSRAEFRVRQRALMRTNQLQRAIGGTSIVTPSEFRRYLNLMAEQRLDHVDVALDEPREHDGSGGVENPFGGGLAGMARTDLGDPAVADDHIAGQPASIPLHGHHGAVADDKITIGNHPIDARIGARECQSSD